MIRVDPGVFIRAIRANRRLAQEIKLLQTSPLFDPIWYRQTNPDLQNSAIDLAKHYLEHGAAEGRDPSAAFSTQFYLRQYRDVAAAKINPLIHYIRHGKSEGRLPRGLNFDAQFYLALYPEVANSGLTPVEHYEQIGRKKHFHLAFDEAWYRAEYPELAHYPTSLQAHFLSEGKEQGRHPAFQHDWYLSEYPDVLSANMDAYSHYVRHGRNEGRHPGFDRNFYLAEYADIAQSTLDPYEHYDAHGRNEGRYPAFNRAWYLLAYKDVKDLEVDPYDHYKRKGREEHRPLSPLKALPTTRLGISNGRTDANLLTTPEWSVPAITSEFAPKVSIIVPNYNHAPFLSQRLNSIYSQTYRNFEVILLDDASSDGSVDILRKYAKQYPELTICRFNERNSGGVFHQWKRGLELAKGELIWIAESDDCCTENFLSELVRFFRNSGVMLAFSRTDFVVGELTNPVWTSEAYLAEVDCNLGASATIIPAHRIVNEVWGARNIAPNVSGVLFRNPGKHALLDDPEWLHLRMCGDWIFYLSIIRGGLVGYSPKATNYYRQHPQNTSIGTHDKDLYYQEHETVSRYVSKLYKVSEGILYKHKEVLYRHWCMKRGNDRQPEFDVLFDLNKSLSERRNRKPNIAVAVYALVPGGGETFPILIANMLQQRGFGVTVVNFEREKTNPGIRALLDKAIPIIEPANSADSAALLAELGVELVHSHHAWVDITLAIALTPYPSIRHVITMHGMYELLHESELRFHEADLLNVDAFVYIAEKNLSAFSTDFARQANFTKIWNAVPPATLSGLSRRDLGIKKSDFVLCLASRAAVDKGWEEAIQAVIAANRRSKRLIRLLLVGDGPEFDRLGKTKLPPFVHLMGFRPNVRDYFALADAGLIATRFKGESCPLVLIECLSVGKPVIATDIGEVKNMLETVDGLAGMVHTLKNWNVDVLQLSEIMVKMANYFDEYSKVHSRVGNAASKFDHNGMIDTYINLYDRVLLGRRRKQSDVVKLSVVLVTYNMARELKRTVRTLSADYQNLAVSDYEIIVVDNGSTCEYNVEELNSVCPNLHFTRLENPSWSPVEALNYGISIARGAVICACIDAARMASPNLLKYGMLACELHSRAVVGALSFHLGLVPQNRSILAGYNQASEDALLETVNWQENGYRLYDIASFDPSSRFGLYSCPAETNSLFMRRELWREYGGFDRAFRGRGGGLANLDIWRRLCEDERNLPVLLLGEGTFHQVHGGVATNARVDPWAEFHSEYITIRGFDYQVPKRTPALFGRMNRWIERFQDRMDGAD